MTPSSFRLIKLFLVSSLVISSFFIEAKAFETEAKQAVLIDFATGKVLFEKNADERMGPSSMTKIMTAYLVFDALKKGDFDLKTTFPVSKLAWKTGGSRMFVNLNTSVPLGDLIQGVIIQSGNDACVVVAEGIAGSVETFAEEMNEKARELGLKNTNFKNPHGLTDENHYSSAKDLAIIAADLIRNFPEYYHYFSEREFTYNKIRQYNRNILLNNQALGVDGLKTGHTDAAGYGIVTSAAKNDMRLVSVVNGLSSSSKRIEETQKLLSYGFVNFKNVQLFGKGDVVESAKVWGGKENAVSGVLKDDLYVLTERRKSNRSEYKFVAKFVEPIPAPIKQGDEIGILEVYEAGKKIQTAKLFAEKDIEEASFTKKLVDKFKLFLSDKI